MGQCTEVFDRLAGDLGDFSCQDAYPIVHLRDPVELSNWTLPVLELMMVAGAAFALWWAMRRLRHNGDPNNLVLWFASIVYLLAVEIPLYFPDVFGVQEHVGVVFAHNVFSVQFLFERLPLYIVALYPATATLAYEIVRAMGVFRDRGPIVGALCVGFVHHCFYEVFDQLGPQLRWWAWNTENPLNHPMLASVPMTSVVIFAALGPAVLVLLVRWLIREDRVHGALGLLWRTVLAGALVPFGIAILAIPFSAFGGDAPNTTAQAIVFIIELVLIAVVAIPVLVGQYRSHEVIRNTYVAIFGPIYLGVLLVLWICSLPTYFEATGGVTGDGTPTGNLAYAIVSFAMAAFAVFCVSRSQAREIVYASA